MPDGRIPKMLLFGQLKEEQGGLGKPLLRFRDILKANLRSCRIDAIKNWEDTAANSERWRQQVSQSIETFEQGAGNKEQSPQPRTKPPAVSVADSVSQG